jgi:syntaxin 6
MSRFHGLTQANPERKKVAIAVTDGCESIKWQVSLLLAKFDPGELWQWQRPRVCTCKACKGKLKHVKLYLLLFVMQLNELDNAVNRAAEQPQRFGLTPEEIASRRKWIGNTRKQVCP